MDRRLRLYLLSFLESYSTILLERGLYFYTHDLLGFSESANLAMALGFGVTYIAGALASHGVTNRFGERRMLAATLLALLAIHSLLAVLPLTPLIVVAFVLLGFLQGFKWPIIESYVTAGRTPRDQLPTIARFNVSWSIAIPLALVTTGMFVESPWPPAVFVAAGLCNVLALALMAHLPRRPVHLDDDHPDRPPAEEIAKLQHLLLSARWAMLGGYTMLFLIAPIMPQIFANFGLEAGRATQAAALFDVVRMATFAFMGFVTVWHGRVNPLAISVLCLPTGFLLILFGDALWIVLLGEALFGIAAGTVYNAALYYAIVVKNAAVDAGGKHEGLIGVGFALGPLIGLSGHHAAALTGSYVTGMLLCVSPLVVLCTLGALRPLVRLLVTPRPAATA